MACVRMDSKAQQKADEMVGKTYGKLTVLESLGLDLDKRYYKVRCQCECGDVRIYNAHTVRKPGKRHSCPECGKFKKLGEIPDTICWDCQKCTNGNLCCWANGKPRNDWQAEPVKIKCANRIIESWRVISCPAFQEDKR